MRKKILSLALALAMCLGLTIPAFATETTYTENRGGITITLTSNSDENRVTISYTGTGKLAADHLEYAVELICRNSMSVEDGALWIEIGSGITSEMDQGHMTQVINEAIPQFGLTFTSVNFGSAPQQPTGTDTTETYTDTYTDTYEGITVTAHSNGPVSYTGAGKLTAEHAEIGVNVFYMATDGAESANTASISVGQGITMTDEFKERWNDLAVYYGDFSVSFNGPTTPTQPDKPAGKVAYASTQAVLVDGKKVEFQMYALKDANGNGTNYIKLRDMAYVLNGTKAQFAVGYDGTISLTTGQAYAAAGGEMTTPFSGDRTYSDGTQSVKVNGKPVEMTAITLLDDAGGGYNYFKLRDLGKALGFDVGWSAETGVIVETDKPYAE